MPSASWWRLESALHMPCSFQAIAGLLAGVVLAGMPFGVRADTLGIRFVHEIQGKPLILDSLRHAGEHEEAYSITRLDWLATEFSFRTKSGKELQHADGLAFVSGHGAALTLCDLPNETITSISFHVGPDPKINHSNPAAHPAAHPLNPNVNRLHWDWQGGYIFMAVEGHWRVKGQKQPEGFAYHLARDPNRVKVTLPLEANLTEPSSVTIALDVGKLLAGLSFAKDGATTHSAEGDPIACRMKANLTGAFRVASVKRMGVPVAEEAPAPIDLPAKPVGHRMTFPRHIPLPALPTDNPLLNSRVKLGEMLFHDKRLSRNHTISCASCHQGEAMADARTFSPGVDGKLSRRHSMPLFNLAWKQRFFWDGRAASLREQVLMPIEDHQEMDESLERVANKLKADESYRQAFRAAFGSGEVTSQNISLALENFLLSRLSLDSKYDQFLKGRARLSAVEQRGFELFFTESEPRLGKRGADCFHCHGGTLFSDHGFHNNGLASLEDFGLEEATGKVSDRRKFATPSLRNIALTAPYMHDGRFATLEEVIDHYNSPPTLSPTLDPNLAKHPQGLGLSEQDKAALVAFLKTLTDPRMER